MRGIIQWKSIGYDKLIIHATGDGVHVSRAIGARRVLEEDFNG